MPAALADAGDGRIWVVSHSSHSGSPLRCEGASSCTMLNLVDPASDRIERKIILQHIVVSTFLPLAGDRLLVFGSGRSGSLPHDPGLLWAGVSGQAGPWLGVIGSNGQIETGAYLLYDHTISALHLMGNDVIVVGNRFALAQTCADIHPGCSRMRIARVASDLRQVRYDSEPLPGFQNYPNASTLGSNGRLYVATAGQIPASADAPFAKESQESFDPFYSGGGLTVIDASTGGLLRATYTRTRPARQLVYDAARNAVWLLAHSTTGNLPATPNALDTFCGEGQQGCGVKPVFCFAVGLCIEELSDITLSRYSADGRSLQYATYAGTGEADFPLGLVLTPDGDLHAAWGWTTVGNYFGPLGNDWLRVPAQGNALRIGRTPTAFMDPLSQRATFISNSASANEIWSVATRYQSNTTPLSLVNSAGLDSECVSNNASCVVLVRTRLLGQVSATVIPAQSPLALLLLIGLLAAGGTLQCVRAQMR